MSVISLQASVVPQGAMMLSARRRFGPNTRQSSGKEYVTLSISRISERNFARRIMGVSVIAIQLRLNESTMKHGWYGLHGYHETSSLYHLVGVNRIRNVLPALISSSYPLHFSQISVIKVQKKSAAFVNFKDITFYLATSPRST
jgi:hypothetical protein